MKDKVDIISKHRKKHLKLNKKIKALKKFYKEECNPLFLLSHEILMALDRLEESKTWAQKSLDLINTRG